MAGSGGLGRRRRLRSNLKAGRGGMQGLGRSGAQAWLGARGGSSRDGGEVAKAGQAGRAGTCRADRCQEHQALTRSRGWG